MTDKQKVINGLLTVAVLAVFGVWLNSALSRVDNELAASDACVVAKLDALPNQSDRVDHIREFTHECMK